EILKEDLIAFNKFLTMEDHTTSELNKRVLEVIKILLTIPDRRINPNKILGILLWRSIWDYENYEDIVNLLLSDPRIKISKLIKTITGYNSTQFKIEHSNKSVLNKYLNFILDKG